MKMYGLIGMICIGVAGCATTGKYEANLRSWEGHPISEVMRSWGIPAKTMTLPDNSKAYEYLSTNGTQTQMDSSYNRFTRSVDTAATTYSVYCRTTFYTNADDQVTSWRWEGNSCRSR